MKKLICIFSLVLFCSINQSKAQLPASLSDIKWTESKHNGFLIANDGTKTEVEFDTYIRISIKEIESGAVVYTVKSTSKIKRSVGDEYKGFQIGDKLFERVNFSTLKAAKRIKFMRPLAKGKIDMYEYIWYTNSEIIDGVTKDRDIYKTSYFFKNNITGKEEFSNEDMTAALDVVVDLVKDNENVIKNFKFRQYDVLDEKGEGVVKRIDLLKMVNDYNAAK